ncbi:MAG: hypothetical protein RL885_02825 [Planctomycetota bacterium]
MTSTAIREGTVPLTERIRVHRDVDRIEEQPLSEVELLPRLRALWEDRASRGVIRYPIDDLRRRQVGRLAVQLNPHRVRKEEDLKRPMEDTMPVLERFGDGPDFLKIHESQPLQRLVDIECEPRPLAINVNYAPILPGHSILIPDPDARRAQHLSPAALKDAGWLLEHTSSRGFTLGFNSLGSWASINHLHFHCFEYPEGDMPVMQAPRAMLREEGPRVEKVEDYPLHAIVVTSSDLADRVGGAARFVSVLQEEDVPHTALLKGDSIWIFPKTRRRGELTPTGSGYLETGGEIFIGDAELFESIDEKALWDELALGRLEEARFGELCDRFLEDLW